MLAQKEDSANSEDSYKAALNYYERYKAVWFFGKGELIKRAADSAIKAYDAGAQSLKQLKMYIGILNAAIAEHLRGMIYPGHSISNILSVLFGAFNYPQRYSDRLSEITLKYLKLREQQENNLTGK